jgi:hypothetical protein
MAALGHKIVLLTGVASPGKSRELVIRNPKRLAPPTDHPDQGECTTRKYGLVLSFASSGMGK